MNADTFRMNRFTLCFADADNETAFADEQARKAVRPVRIAFVVLGALQVGNYVLTTHVFKSIVVGIGALNTLLTTIEGLLLYAVFYALSYRPIFLKRQQLIMFLLACLISVGVTQHSARLPLDIIDARGFTIMLVYIFFIYSVLRLRFPQAALAGWLGAAFFVGYLFGLDLMGPTAAGRSALILGIANCGGMLISYQMDISARREFSAMRLLGKERERSERLLLNILPAPIAERLKASEDSIAEHSDGVTVLFADIVGFTPLSASKTPQALVELLNRIFSEFDALADMHGLEKIKTIGDAYMAVAGLPNPRPDHAPRAARMALAMLDATARVAAETGEQLALRIGLDSGPVVAGVIGRRKFTYDLWGDTVNTASRMESHGVPGAIHFTETTGMLLQGTFRLQARGAMVIKGKGDMNTFLLFTPEAIPIG
ncbi:MAG: adenylate/guanylate cyclase domain-containing protein [Proteobacteria bacterium]|nr:adenylate/guanylate cyclase domain-containing protein [Pseudomonadota bacterium]